MAKYSCLNDWKRIALINNEYFCGTAEKVKKLFDVFILFVGGSSSFDRTSALIIRHMPLLLPSGPSSPNPSLQPEALSAKKLKMVS